MVLSEECERKEQEMPIKVRYDDDISALAQLALATGAKGLPQSRAPARGGGGGGRGSRGGQPRAEDISAADLAVLQEDAAENAFQRGMEMEEQQVQTAMEQFEWKLDITAKKRQNQHRRELAWLRSPEAREHYEENEIAFMEGETMRSLLNPQKTPYEKQPDPTDNLMDDQDNPVQLNQVFTDDSGNKVSFQMGSRGQVVREVHTKYADTKQYLDAEAERDIAIKTGEIDQKRREYAGKLMEKPVPVYENGVDQGKTRMLEFSEAMKRARYVYPVQAPESPELTQEQLEGELQQRVDTFKVEEIAREEALENPIELIAFWNGMEGSQTEREKKLPQFEGMARSFIREIRRRQKSGRTIPASAAQAIKQALAIMERADKNAKR